MTFSEVTNKISTDDTDFGLSSIHINNQPDYVRLTLFEYDRPSKKYRYLYILRSSDYILRSSDRCNSYPLVGEMYTSFRNIEDIRQTIIYNHESIHDFTTVPKSDNVIEKIERINGIMRSSMLSIADKYLKSAYLHKLRYTDRYYISKSFGDYPPSVYRTGKIESDSDMGVSRLETHVINFNYGLEGHCELNSNIIGESDRELTVLIPSKFSGSNCELVEIDEEIYNRFRQLQQTCIKSIQDLLLKYFSTQK